MHSPKAMAASGYQVLLREALAILFFLIPSILTDDTDTNTDITVSSIFQIPLTDAELGTCFGYKDILQDWFVESQTMLNAGLQAFADAADPSSPNHQIALDYLFGHWGLTTSSKATEITDVTAYLKGVSKFYTGGGVNGGGVTPYLFCSDSWAIKMKRTDACRQADTSEKKYVTQTVDGVQTLVAIENVEVYADQLWKWDKKTKAYVSNGNVPYWSDYLLEYFFAPDPGEGKTYCQGLDDLGASQTYTDPRTMTLCPDSFTITGYSNTLGAVVPKAGMSIQSVLPKSATLYHESFHLVMLTISTPDFTYLWSEAAKAMKSPTTENDFGTTNIDSIRRNPESYVWFSVGYWYFQQVNKDWGTTSTQRWSFHNGKAEKVMIKM